MKNLLLILALFVGNSFSKDEYPIELTCEVIGSVVYLSLNETKKGSWYRPHESSRDNPYFPYKKGAGKKNPFKYYYKIKEGVITVELGGSYFLQTEYGKKEGTCPKVDFEAEKKIGSYKTFIKKTATLNVANKQASLPNDFLSLIIEKIKIYI